MAHKAEPAEPLLHSQSQPHGCYGVPAPFPGQEPPYEQPYVALPLYRLTRRRRNDICNCCSSLIPSSLFVSVLLVSVLLVSAAFFLWPSSPQLTVVRLHLDHVRVHTYPTLSLDISMNLKVRIRNPDFFSLDYRSIVVTIGYRGKPLGFVSSDVGHVRARGVSYVDAELRLNGIQIIQDAFYLIEDLARGSIPFDTVTETDGQLNFLLLDFPVQGRWSCTVYVNPENQTVIHQECY